MTVVRAKGGLPGSHKGGHLAVRLPPDLGPGGAVVGRPVGGAVELVGPVSFFRLGLGKQLCPPLKLPWVRPGSLLALHYR